VGAVGACIHRGFPGAASGKRARRSPGEDRDPHPTHRHAAPTANTRQISTTLVAVAVGGLMLMIPGAVLGLCLGIILWTADAIQDV
jgi:hypothetical protein